MKEEIKIGDIVQEKEGLRRNGLVFEILEKSTPTRTYTAAKVYWPDGKQMTLKLSFLEKMF